MTTIIVSHSSNIGTLYFIGLKIRIFYDNNKLGERVIIL